LHTGLTSGSGLDLTDIWWQRVEQRWRRSGTRHGDRRDAGELRRADKEGVLTRLAHLDVEVSGVGVAADAGGLVELWSAWRRAGVLCRDPRASGSNLLAGTACSSSRGVPVVQRQEAVLGVDTQVRVVEDVDGLGERVDRRVVLRRKVEDEATSKVGRRHREGVVGLDRQGSLGDVGPWERAHKRVGAAGRFDDQATTTAIERIVAGGQQVAGHTNVRELGTRVRRRRRRRQHRQCDALQVEVDQIVLRSGRVLASTADDAGGTHASNVGHVVGRGLARAAAAHDARLVVRAVGARGAVGSQHEANGACGLVRHENRQHVRQVTRSHEGDGGGAGYGGGGVCDGEHARHCVGVELRRASDGQGVGGVDRDGQRRGGRRQQRQLERLRSTDVQCAGDRCKDGTQHRHRHASRHVVRARERQRVGSERQRLQREASGGLARDEHHRRWVDLCPRGIGDQLHREQVAQVAGIVDADLQRQWWIERNGLGRRDSQRTLCIAVERRLDDAEQSHRGHQRQVQSNASRAELDIHIADTGRTVGIEHDRGARLADAKVRTVGGGNDAARRGADDKLGRLQWRWHELELERERVTTQNAGGRWHGKAQVAVAIRHHRAVLCRVGESSKVHRHCTDRAALRLEVARGVAGENLRWVGREHYTAGRCDVHANGCCDSRRRLNKAAIREHTACKSRVDQEPTAEQTSSIGYWRVVELESTSTSTSLSCQSLISK
jgi:hypothetical protein